MHFGWWTKKGRANKKIADGLYRAARGMSRRSYFYDELGVADTLQGRFDMLCLIMVVLMARLRADPQDRSGLEQSLFDVMFLDLDTSLREMGAGDLGIPRKLKRMMNGFHGRFQAYQRTKDDDSALVMFLRRNLEAASGFSGHDRKLDAERLREEIMTLRADLDGLTIESLETAMLSPEPIKSHRRGRR